MAMNSPPMFRKFALLLNEDKPGSERPLTARNSVENLESSVMPETETLIARVGKLLMAKIRAHSGLEPDLFTPDETLKKHPESLVPVMYRIATEGFVKSSKSPFKLIECRNITKLASDWKPSLPDFLISAGHQVILVELKEAFGPYNDFVYAVLRQMNYDWNIRLPRSFFYPDDVCTTIATSDEQLILITPSNFVNTCIYNKCTIIVTLTTNEDEISQISLQIFYKFKNIATLSLVRCAANIQKWTWGMPDGEMEFSERLKNSLQYDILMMLKASCESSMENHLLMRDLRVGKFADTFDGVTSIRNVYRSLQERLKSGGEICLGRSSEELKLYMMSGAGDSILNAEALLDACKVLGVGLGEPESGKGVEMFKENSMSKESGPDLCASQDERSDTLNYKLENQNDIEINSRGGQELSSEMKLKPESLSTK